MKPLKRIPELEAWRARRLREKPALLEPRARSRVRPPPDPSLFELPPRSRRRAVRTQLVAEELAHRERRRAESAGQRRDVIAAAINDTTTETTHDD
jgi:hypothetical protein